MFILATTGLFPRRRGFNNHYNTWPARLTGLAQTQERTPTPARQRTGRSQAFVACSSRLIQGAQSLAFSARGSADSQCVRAHNIHVNSIAQRVKIGPAPAHVRHRHRFSHCATDSCRPYRALKKARSYCQGFHQILRRQPLAPHNQPDKGCTYGKRMLRCDGPSCESSGPSPVDFDAIMGARGVTSRGLADSSAYTSWLALSNMYSDRVVS